MSANTNADVAAMVTRAKASVEILANTSMDMSLEEWGLTITPILEAIDLAQSQQAEITRLSAMVEEKDAAIVALADGAEKCAEAPYHIVQPFLRVYRKHGEAIDRARQAISTQEPTP